MLGSAYVLGQPLKAIQHDNQNSQNFRAEMLKAPHTETALQANYARKQAPLEEVECSYRAVVQMLTVAWLASRFDDFPNRVPLKSSTMDTALVMQDDQWRLERTNRGSFVNYETVDLVKNLAAALNVHESGEISRNVADLSVWGKTSVAGVVLNLFNAVPAHVMHSSLGAGSALMSNFGVRNRDDLVLALRDWTDAIREFNLDPDDAPLKGVPPALVALARRNDDIGIEALAKAGIDISRNGSEAIGQAVEYGAGEAVSMLLELGANPGPDLDGRGPLSTAIRILGGSVGDEAIAIVRILCEAGLDPDAKDPDGRSPADHLNDMTEHGQYLGEFGQRAWDLFEDHRKRSGPMAY